MFGIESEIKIKNKSIKWLAPVLEQWLRVHRDYIEANDCEDSLYWYNERANVGALAGAIWRSGGYALEEFGAQKGKDDEVSNGRVDLYFQYSGRDVVVEAKQSWVYLAPKSRRDFRSLIDTAIGEANDDIRRTQDSLEYEFGLGLAFLPTYSKDSNQTEDAMDRFHREIKNTNCDFYVWLKNTSGKSLIGSKGDCCDAIALIGNLIL
ncbi:hypothetical protein [Endozoicomonas ascidiicola]|uniref:hypothetical protein n=1 Tax=Endozoicomonas ascidiicola TaxID=1698521 RepID=UPI00082C9A52|nr:hypothetical protein [Endozoicomonas ascidiicola]